MELGQHSTKERLDASCPADPNCTLTELKSTLADVDQCSKSQARSKKAVEGSFIVDLLHVDELLGKNISILAADTSES